MSVTLYIMRHGETDWNKEKRLMGHFDVPINEVGLQQAHVLVKKLYKIKLDSIYSSDLRRALQTSEVLADQLGISKIKSDYRLREAKGGVCEGLTWAEMHQAHPEWWERDQKDWYSTPYPGGESLLDVANRVEDMLNELAKNQVGKHIGVVTHWGVICAVLISVLKIDQEHMKRVHIDNCGLTVVHWGEEKSLLRLNA
ncbi:phosphoglycerate mutase [Paenibacillus glycanilyticus]|uniref:Phosphoglycerate mutase n=1 Tax=Paenibacillus glycanilyticus TaxID=126569 RepID=A0ABQ6NQD2_9BACL|nr:histidine phosphatase family protein [Paenibacillus glycanilyticus]GMK47013.1 phosphoglycerate mutase [Paenibacillus glycanilyticus]